jgi:hypothetical protein
MEFLIAAIVLGTMLAFAAVLAIWLALGHGRAMRRATLTLLGASAGALVFCAVSGELEAEWLGLAWVVVVTITAMLAFVRWLGFHLVDTKTDGSVRSDEMQFSLRQLMALTAVVAVIAAVARMLAPLVATRDALIFGLAIAICLGVLALLTLWAMLPLDITRSKSLVLAIVASVMAGLVYYGMEATDADPGLIWGAVVLVYAMALAGALLLLRRYGFRLRYASPSSQNP